VEARVTERDEDLPAAFVAASAGDEAFWKTQEKKVQGAMGQPCCTLSGISTWLMAMEGQFAVIVHGEDECAACFRHVGPSNFRFFCTGLTEHHFVTGETAGPLRRCLELVAEEVDPDAILVLGACPIEVIGDRFETVVDEARARYPDIPMVALHTSGLGVGSQSAMLDWLFSTLATFRVPAPMDGRWHRDLGVLTEDLLRSFHSGDPHAMSRAHEAAAALRPQPTPAPDRCLNLIGLPKRSGGRAEYDDVVDEVGLTVVSNFPHDASFRDWGAITYAKASFVADTTLYPRLMTTLREAGQEIVSIPLPVGLSQTDAFYTAIGETFGCLDAIRAATAKRREVAAAHIERIKSRWGGMRLAMGLRMLNNYSADQLAYGGMGDLAALVELGFDMTLLVQGPPEKRDRFQAMFDRLGMNYPFKVFPEPWNMSEHLTAGGFQVAYLADHCRAEARKAGVPMIVSRDFEPFYSGVAGNLEHLERTLLQIS
jgi:nitrogenase molybdenum-iron protein alpha/beta subunit